MYVPVPYGRASRYPLCPYRGAPATTLPFFSGGEVEENGLEADSFRQKVRGRSQSLLAYFDQTLPMAPLGSHKWMPRRLPSRCANSLVQ